jgi:hypothetical protein
MTPHRRAYSDSFGQRAACTRLVAVDNVSDVNVAKATQAFAGFEAAERN